MILPTRFVVACGLLACLLAMNSCNLLKRGDDTAARQRLEILTKQNLRIIEHELDKWSKAHSGLYPDDIDSFLYSGEFTEMPLNPASLSPMRQVAYTDQDRSGNFSFYPIYGEDSVKGFYLLCYGLEGSTGIDVDGNDTDDNVLLVISAGDGLPPLPEVVRGNHAQMPPLFARLDDLRKRIEQAANSDQGGQRFPASLASDGAPVELPMNPFTEGKMRQVKIGDPAFAGNFSYIPFTLNGVVRGYYLLGYGKDGTAGLDVNNDGAPDHVVKILSNGPDSMPKLAILIGQLQGSVAQ